MSLLRPKRATFQRLLFGLMYRVGFTPWDGHALPVRLRRLLEGPEALPPGRAIDLGCGTGDTSICLAQHGWDVVALDLVTVALKRARAKARIAGARVQWIRGDVTRLESYGVTSGVHLCVDNGCLHVLSDEARSAYVRSVTAIAARHAPLIITAFPHSIGAAEIARRFSDGWELLASEVDPNVRVSYHANHPVYVHELRRR